MMHGNYLFAIFAHLKLLLHCVKVIIPSDIWTASFTKTYDFSRLVRFFCLHYRFEFSLLYDVLEAETQNQKSRWLPVEGIHLDILCLRVVSGSVFSFIFACVGQVLGFPLSLQFSMFGNYCIELVTLLSHHAPRHHVVWNVKHDDLACLFHIVGWKP